MGRISSRITLLLLALCFPALADTSLQWSWGNPSPNGDNFTTIAFGGGVYVAAGQDGVIYSSPDGTTWSPASSVIGNGGTYLDALYANGDFVLAGADAGGLVHVTSSTDGVHWSDKALNLHATLYGNSLGGLELAFGNGGFVLMAADGEATSSDAVNWTIRSLGFRPFNTSETLAYANGVFILQGEPTGGTVADETIFYSSDGGVTWSPSASMKGVIFLGDVASDGSSFFIYNDSPAAVYTSTDGNHWTKQAPSGTPPQFGGRIIWDGTRFVAVASTPDVDAESQFTSPDGLAWTQGPALRGFAPTASIYALHTIVTTAGGYAGVSDGPLTVLASTDAITWTEAFSATTVSNARNLTDVVHGDGVYVAVGYAAAGTNVILESPDGTAWTSVYTGSGPTGLQTVAFGGGKFIAQGGDTWLVSADGTHWSPIADPPQSTTSKVAYGAGRFVVFAGCPSDCTIATSSDGQTWTSQAMPAALVSVQVHEIGYDGTRFVSIGDSGIGDAGTPSTSAVFTSCDGINWVHSGDIQLQTNTVFYRIQEVGGTLVALGDDEPVCTAGGSACIDSPSFQVVATSKDTVTWSAVTSTTDSTDTFLDGVVSDGSSYYAANFDNQIVTSSDALHWSVLSGVPMAASPNAMAGYGTQLVAVGFGSTIIATTPNTGSVAPLSGGACKPLPAVSSGGGDDFDLFTLVALLGLWSARRRGT